MYNLIIVDDETIVRTSLATIVDWDEEGFSLVGDAVNGKAALKLIQETDVDVVLTDIKMPVMDGIELIEVLSQMEHPPVVAVLSAYSDFDLVRQAFKLGAADYILKTDISREVIRESIKNLKQKLEEIRPAEPSAEKAEIPVESRLREALLGTRPFSGDFYTDHYAVACLEIEHFVETVARFGEDLEHSLIQPMISFAQQLPRVSSRCVITSLSSSRYILLYRGEACKGEELASICVQIKQVWKNYMNITVTAGISGFSRHSDDFTRLVQDGILNTTAKYIFGIEGVYGPEVRERFDIAQAVSSGERCQSLMHCMRHDRGDTLLVEYQNLYTRLRHLELEDARRECLYIIYQTAVMLADCNDCLESAFHLDINFYQKVFRLETLRDLEMWITNFIRWVSDYIEEKFSCPQNDVMEKVKKFIISHYADPALSMSSVASYVGFNEKYFSTRFNREMGVSFVSYLTNIRIQTAKKMLETTAMKIYEVSEAVGYSNVEHFTRVFKKVTGVSPSVYRK